MEIKEKFASLLEAPDRIKFRDFLKNNFGESDCIDFKSQWCSYPKLAKHILAIANAGGGIIVFGVSEPESGQYKPIGLDKLVDAAELSNGVDKFLPNKLKVELYNFVYEESEYNDIKGKKFQLIWVKSDTRYLPYIAIKTSGDEIRQNIIYIRRGTQSLEVNYDELQELINKRIETEYSSTSELNLEEHLAQLKVLYKQIPEFHYISEMSLHLSEEEIQSIFAEQEALTVKNANYPEESYEKFVSKMIVTKKHVIEVTLRGSKLV